MRIFGGDRVQRAMTALNVPDDMPIQSRFISSAIEKSQTRVEGRNFDMRKHVVEYDDVINYHREIVYKKRRQVLASDSIKANVLDYLQELSNNLVIQHKQGKTYDYREIFESINAIHEPGSDSLKLEQLENISDEKELREFIFDFFVARFNGLVSNSNQAKLNDALRFLYLNTIDTFWMEHIDDMGYLRQNVSLHAYGQKDPLVEYKQQAYLRFKDLLVKIRFGFISSIFKALLEK